MNLNAPVICGEASYDLAEGYHSYSTRIVTVAVSAGK